MSAITIEVFYKDKTREMYLQAMKETKFGWEASKSKHFNHVGCPDDLYFVSSSDLPHPVHCVMDCERCWNYVLEKKWGKKSNE